MQSESESLSGGIPRDVAEVFFALLKHAPCSRPSGFQRNSGLAASNGVGIGTGCRRRQIASSLVLTFFFRTTMFFFPVFYKRSFSLSGLWSFLPAANLSRQVLERLEFMRGGTRLGSHPEEKSG